jgi:hypothetical protein
MFGKPEQCAGHLYELRLTMARAAAAAIAPLPPVGPLLPSGSFGRHPSLRQNQIRSLFRRKKQFFLLCHLSATARA